MAKLIKNIIDDNSEAVFNLKKLEVIVESYHRFIHKNDNHIAFFGGNLIGVYPIRFKDEDKENIIEDICGIVDFENLTDELHDVKEIDKRRHVSGNPINYLYIWLLNKIWTSSNPMKAKEKAMVAAMNLFQIKYLTGLDAHFFKYPADESIAHAVYEDMSRKSLLKQLGNWKAVVEKRSQDLTGKRSVWWETLTKMEDNGEVVKMVNDIQTRVRKGYGNISNMFHELREREAKILSSSTFATIDGERVMREFENNLHKYKRSIVNILLDPNDLIKQDLLDDTLKLIDAANETNLRATLNFISENADTGKKNDILDEIENLVLYIFEYISKSDLNATDVPGVIGRLRSIYRSHRSSHEAVVAIKDKMDYIVPKAITARHEATRSGTKVAVLVYLSLRILSIPFYNG